MFNTSNIEITPEILRFIAEIDEFKGAWRALDTLGHERLNALRRIATIESIGSSTRIEGNQLSDREVERLLTRVEPRSFVSRDEEEVAGYAAVMELIFQTWQEIPINENHIQQLHRDLLQYSQKTTTIAAHTKNSQIMWQHSTMTASPSPYYLKRQRHSILHGA